MARSKPTGDKHDPVVPSDADPEIKRLRMLGEPERPRQRHRADGPPAGPAKPRSGLPGMLLVVFIVAAAIAALVMVAIQSRHDHPEPMYPIPNPSTSVKAEQETNQIDEARRYKPLYELRPGDRVLYDGEVCLFRRWENGVNTSTIKCDEVPEFQISTARLVPVERTR